MPKDRPINTKIKNTKRSTKSKQLIDAKKAWRGLLDPHKKRLIWFVVLIVGLLFIQFAYNLRMSGQPKVLAYSTTMNMQTLLADTNQYRASAGLAPLKLNDQLSRGAQNKAGDMIKNNYWSHVTPNGTQPWYFFQKAGYNYKDAGENLAYGFATDSEVITGWMNSPHHKENVLGNYTEVGFGFANGEHYQTGENTVVVAFYATPENSSPVANLQKPTQHQPVYSKAPPVILGEQTQAISGLPGIISGSANWAIYASLGLFLAAAIGFIVSHLELLRAGWFKGRHFLAVHPIFDLAILLGILVGILRVTGGFVR